MTDENTHTSMHTFTSTHTVFEVPVLRVKFHSVKSVELKQYVLEALSPSFAVHCLNFVVLPVAGLHVFTAR